mgnify:FL=1
MTQARYAWKITKDHSGDGMYSGPKNANPELKENPARFSLYCDDECVAEGMLYGDYDGFEPLEDYGEPSLGCCSIKIDGDWL